MQNQIRIFLEFTYQIFEFIILFINDLVIFFKYCAYKYQLISNKITKNNILCKINVNNLLIIDCLHFVHF